jgi:large subunit ribosomal protein L3
MAIGLLGRKVGMTQIYDETGRVIPVTVIHAGPCDVLQLRTAERDGYEAVQIGFLDKPRRLARRSERGHVARLDSKRSKRLSMGGVELLSKANCEPKRFIREFRAAVGDIAIGQQLTVSLFAEVRAVDVTGTSKGRGTSGVIRRHHFAGQRASHGVKKVHRHPGSSGMNTFPARVFKGKKMAGRLGNERVTARNLKVVKVDADQNLLLVRGAVPGPNGGYLIIRQTNKV